MINLDLMSENSSLTGISYGLRSRMVGVVPIHIVLVVRTTMVVNRKHVAPVALYW